MHLNVTRLE